MIKSRVSGFGRLSLVTAAAAVAVLLAPDVFASPAWRGQEGATMQQWSFSDANYAPATPDDGWTNDAGTPFLWVGDHAQWDTGAWTLFTDQIDVAIPGDAQIQSRKEMWIEVLWKPAGQNYLPDKPLLSVDTETACDRMEIVRALPDSQAGDGWISTVFKVDIWPDPPLGEWVSIRGDILVDQLVIDTRSIPEPATLVLLTIGGLLCQKRVKNT